MINDYKNLIHSSNLSYLKSNKKFLNFDENLQIIKDPVEELFEKDVNRIINMVIKIVIEILRAYILITIIS